MAQIPTVNGNYQLTLDPGQTVTLDTANKFPTQI